MTEIQQQAAGELRSAAEFAVKEITDWFYNWNADAMHRMREDFVVVRDRLATALADNRADPSAPYASLNAGQGCRTGNGAAAADTPPQAAGRKPQVHVNTRDCEPMSPGAAEAIGEAVEKLAQHYGGGTGGGGQPPTHSLNLKRIDHDLKFADTVMTDQRPDGTAFYFKDSSGHVHASMKVGCPWATAPDGAIGAVKVEQHWHWVIAGAADPARRQQTPQWVPVGERLPTPFYSVLVHVVGCERIYCAPNEGYTDIGIWNDERQKWQVNFGEEDIDADVTHWMPLPAAPDADAPPRPPREPQERQPQAPGFCDECGGPGWRKEVETLFPFMLKIWPCFKCNHAGKSKPMPADFVPVAPTPAPTLTAEDCEFIEGVIGTLHIAGRPIAAGRLREIRDRLLAAGAPAADVRETPETEYDLVCQLRREAARYEDERDAAKLGKQGLRDAMEFAQDEIRAWFGNWNADSMHRMRKDFVVVADRLRDALAADAAPAAEGGGA